MTVQLEFMKNLLGILGFPFCAGKPSKSLYDQMIEKFGKMLSMWKSENLPFGQRIILL